jgi:hypothetical protein
MTFKNIGWKITLAATMLWNIFSLGGNAQEFDQYNAQGQNIYLPAEKKEKFGANTFGVCGAFQYRNSYQGNGMGIGPNFAVPIFFSKGDGGVFTLSTGVHGGVNYSKSGEIKPTGTITKQVEETALGFDLGGGYRIRNIMAILSAKFGFAFADIAETTKWNNKYSMSEHNASTDRGTYYAIILSIYHPIVDLGGADSFVFFYSIGFGKGLENPDYGSNLKMDAQVGFALFFGKNPYKKPHLK